MERQILHVVVPFFPIALARVTEPRLRKRPVAVAPGNSERALVQCASAEAADEGVTAGTPLFRARRICPSLVVIPPDPLLTARGNRILGEVAAQYTPLVEPAAGRIFLDLTGSRRLFGPPRDVAARLGREISARLDLDTMAGSGVNKLVSRLAADVLPERGVYDVFIGSERHFLAPFPVSVLPGIGHERQAILLRDLNLQRVEQVAALTVPQLSLALGCFAPLLHERARGIDRSPVQPPRRSTDITEEAFLEQEENDDAVLLSELLRMTEGCGLRLRRLAKGARKVSLTVSYADGVTQEGNRLLPSPVSLDLSLFSVVEELFFSTCKRRVRLRGLRLSCRQLDQDLGQMELFPAAPSVCETAEKYAPLQGTLDTLRGKYGHSIIRWGRGMVAATETIAGTEPAAIWNAEETRYMTLTKNDK